ncbi:hypothetical protein D5S17_14790 [Pseudonocardiaceae bacterium YIM PH 21723]|nr:hypothetical protein D5S17_14790 [Pseudonocardiaceae bacterium YIM PH 21723]
MGDERGELTADDQESLREKINQVRRSLDPDLNRQLPSLAQLIPESVLTTSSALSAFTEGQQAIISNALKPFLASHVFRQGMISAFGSDLFKASTLPHSKLSFFTSEVAKNIDLGVGEAMRTAVSRFAKQQTAWWLSAIGPAVVNFKAAFYPPNLQDIRGLRLAQVKQVVMDDGIPLYGLPRAATAEALVNADSAGMRRDILGRRWRTISRDCREAVTVCKTTRVAPYIVFAVAALDALDAGHTAAAQALAGSLVDTIVRASFRNWHKFTPDSKGKNTKDAYGKFTVRQYIVLAPMWQTYQQYWVNNGDPVPTTFSRHATAHTVGRRQYTRRNAVQALMFACSLLYWLDEEMTTRAVA